MKIVNVLKKNTRPGHPFEYQFFEGLCYDTRGKEGHELPEAHPDTNEQEKKNNGNCKNPVAHEGDILHGEIAKSTGVTIDKNMDVSLAESGHKEKASYQQQGVDKQNKPITPDEGKHWNHFWQR